MVALQNYLQIPLDILPMSQIYYSWSNRNLLSTTDKSPLETKHLILIATEVEEDTNALDIGKLSAKQKDELLGNPMDTFFYAFEAEAGEGSRMLIKMAYHMAHLGASVDDIIEMVHKVNDYWVSPMKPSRLQSTITNQLQAIVSKVQQ
jgi:hypothetical protein